MNEWGLLRQQFNELKDVTLTVKDGKPGTFQVEAGFWPKRAADFRLLATGAAKRLTGIARPDLWFQHVYENCLPGEFRLDQSYPAPVSEVETDGTERPVTVEFWSTAGNAGTICGNAAGRLAEQGSDSTGPEPEKGQATKSEKGKPRRKYMKREDAERIAKEKFNQLRQVCSKVGWARQIGCQRGTVGKLTAWHRAEKYRKGWRQISTRLKGTVDPKIIEAMCTSGKSALGTLTKEERDQINSLSDQTKAEILELVDEQSRDDVS